MTHQHIMIDIETMGKGSYAAIVSFGAVKFDPYGTDVQDKFYCRVSLDSSLKAGLRVDADTVDWWMDEKRGEARKALYSDPPQDLINVLEGFAEWANSDRDLEPVIWGNGATFDNVIVANAYTVLGLQKPWSFRNDRCYRTLRVLGRNAPQPPRVGTGHHALDDAVWQALHAQVIVNYLGIKV